jgi:hypothetical protein
MNISAVNTLEISNLLSFMPDEKLETVKTFLKFMLFESGINFEQKKQNNTLKGIWRHKGFEKLKNLENDIVNIRKELSESILSRNVL